MNFQSFLKQKNRLTTKVQFSSFMDSPPDFYKENETEEVKVNRNIDKKI